MGHPLRFEVLIVPNVSWDRVLERFRSIEALGFDLGGFADHFVDWTNPPLPWFDLWATLGAVAQATTTLRLRRVSRRFRSAIRRRSRARRSPSTTSRAGASSWGSGSDSPSTPRTG